MFIGMGILIYGLGIMIYSALGHRQFTDRDFLLPFSLGITIAFFGFHLEVLREEADTDFHKTLKEQRLRSTIYGLFACMAMLIFAMIL